MKEEDRFRSATLPNAQIRPTGGQRAERVMLETPKSSLRESEAHLKLAMEAGQMGAWEWIFSSGKVVWSPTLEALHGIAPGMFGGTFDAFKSDMHPDDVERVVSTVQTCMRDQSDYRVEYRIIKPDGVLAWLEARGKIFADSSGQPERMAGICMDITARKQAEEALRQSGEFNRMIIDGSRDCINTLSPDGTLLWVSDLSQNLLSKSIAGEVIGKSWLDYWNGSERELARAAVESAAAGGTGTMVGCMWDGTQPRYWESVITPMLDRDGRAERLLAISRDITERRTLDALHSRLAAVVECSDDAIISESLENRIMTWNKGAERIFGFESPEVIGQPVAVWIPADHLEEEMRTFKRVLSGEAVPSYETIPLRKDGKLLEVSLTVSPIKDSTGTIVGVSKIARDTSERKRADLDRARLTSILDESLNEIYIFDTENLLFQYVNQGALRNLGYTMKQMRQLTPIDLKPEFTEAQFRKLVAPLLRREQEKMIFYTVHRRANGTDYPVEVHLQAVTQAAQTLFMAVILNITERKKVEEDRERLLVLEQSARAKAEEAEVRAKFLAHASGSLSSSFDYEDTLRKLANAVVPQIADWCSIYIVDSRGTPRIVAVAHADPAKLSLGDELRARYPDPPDSPYGIPAVLRTGKPQIFSKLTDDFFASTAQDAGHLDLLRRLELCSAMVVPLIANERVCGALALVYAESGRHFTEADLPFAEDLAARAAAAAENARLYQELRHANAAKDHFIAVLSHELRTPLNPVLMTVADLESEKALPAEVREQLTVVRRNVELEARLIDDLLDSTRITSGKLRLERTVVDAGELLTRAMAIIEGDCRYKGRAPKALAVWRGVSHRRRPCTHPAGDLECRKKCGQVQPSRREHSHSL